MYFTPEVIKLKTVKRKGGHELTEVRLEIVDPNSTCCVTTYTY